MIDHIILGQGLLWLATILALSTSVAAFKSPAEKIPLQLMIQGQALCLGLAFLSLIIAFIRSDFSLMVVTLNSAVTTPLIYKISAAWSHHEGSLLLWVLLMALFQPLLIKQAIQPRIKRFSIGVHSLLIFLFSIFILATSNPFARLFPVPLDGHDLNPMLQDISVIFHPPLLYAGLQGFSILFSLTVGILLNRRHVPAAGQWASWMRPWALLSTAALTGGITLGSFWAYYELGWGGWWFWDPVENISLIPWLVSIGLLHSLKVLIHNGGSGRWVLFQSLTIYALTLIGLVMVRSGSLTSVHGFAQDHERGLVLLFMVTSILASVYSLFFLNLKSTKHASPSLHFKSSGLLFQSLFFLLAAGVLLLGTVYPLLMNLFNDTAVHVGPSFYRATIIPLMLPAFLLLGILPFVEEGSDQNVLKKTLPIALGAAVLLLLGFWINQTPSLSQFFCYTGGVVGGWLTLLTVMDAFVKWRNKRWSLQVAGMILAHLGISLFILTASVERWGSQDWTTTLQIGQSMPVPLLENATLRLNHLERNKGPNYVAEQAQLILTVGKETFTLSPEKRHYVPAGQLISESAQQFNWGTTYYVTMGESYTNGALTITLAIHPLVVWIWLSALLAVFGLVLVRVRPATYLPKVLQ
jgi:cytochrome c-type biogenesis protein CcmF